jgi:ubiquinone/menaquinone biosynthesis C-methylase UbiE
VTQTPASLARDFDRIARLPDDPWDHNRLYHARLLRQVPPGARDALEIGCGTGELTRKLAERVGRVTALDLSKEMLAAARLRCTAFANVRLLQRDVLAFPLQPESHDVIASIATLHHLPLGEMFGRVSRALRPGGVFLALDIADERTSAGVARALAAAPLNVLGRLATTGRPRSPAAARAAWQAHGASDLYPPLRQVRRLAAELLPGARVRHHLFWRWSLVWRKPA